MSRSDIDQVILRMAGDPDFAAEVSADPDAALAGLGLSPAERALVVRAVEPAGRGAQALTRRLSKSSVLLLSSGGHALAAASADAAPHADALAVMPHGQIEAVHVEPAIGGGDPPAVETHVAPELQAPAALAQPEVQLPAAEPAQDVAVDHHALPPVAQAVGDTTDPHPASTATPLAAVTPAVQAEAAPPAELATGGHQALPNLSGAAASPTEPTVAHIVPAAQEPPTGTHASTLVATQPATHLNPEWLPAEQRVELDQQQLDHDHARIDHDTHSLLADQSKLLDDIGARDEARHQVDVDNASIAAMQHAIDDVHSKADQAEIAAGVDKVVDPFGADAWARSFGGHESLSQHAQELRFEESELRDDLHTLEQMRDADQAHLDAVQATVDHDQAVVDADHHRLDGDHARLDRDQADYDRDWLEAHPTERAIAEARHLPAAVNVEP